jgi:hypothetical protein
VEGTVEAAQIPVESGRVGNRWINYRPEATEIADWFQTIRLHEGMEHEDWLSGITLIEATEKHDHIIGFAQDGRPQIMKDVQSLHLIPYTRVDARVAYFNRLMEIHGELTGFILPVAAADPKGMAVGFYAMKVALPDGKIATAVCYTARVLVIEGEVEWEEEVDPDGVTRLYPHGKIVMAGAHGTKSVPLVDRWGRFDANAVMKAQTGGVGRALGYAGMLVIPGTGVATAEDMREALDQGATPGSPPAAPGPPGAAGATSGRPCGRPRAARRGRGDHGPAQGAAPRGAGRVPGVGEGAQVPQALRGPGACPEGPREEAPEDPRRGAGRAARRSAGRASP